jgi:hypothetical protein
MQSTQSSEYFFYKKFYSAPSARLGGEISESFFTTD